MNWQPPTLYAQESEDRRYSVCWITIGNRNFYEAWRTRRHKDGPHLIGTKLPSQLAGRRLCEADDEACAA